ncbi:hypothetical protein JK636_18640 [Clostridium sp. YIM B02515]|uniref:DUF4367 domain-containing protein n=1 Tax=Clostridium rhizosphaerae TaxID=2803861 RepID=A0ABS1TEE5_9CLOT|nr:hypothetical protein [Clostridium rhizosphaerae]MBL4937728.1 hypothetical protein [Clostridium rhizosphaerae]
MNCKIFRKNIYNLSSNNNISNNFKKNMLKHIESCTDCRYLYKEFMEDENILKTYFRSSNECFNSVRNDVLKNIDRDKYKNCPSYGFYISYKKYKKYYISAVSFLICITSIYFYLDIKNNYSSNYHTIAYENTKSSSLKGKDTDVTIDQNIPDNTEKQSKSVSLDSLSKESYFKYTDFENELIKSGYTYKLDIIDKNETFLLLSITLTIDKNKINIYEYTNSSNIENEANKLAMTTLKAKDINSLQNPHYYKKGHIIVEYLGNNSETIKIIEQIMGA